MTSSCPRSATLYRFCTAAIVTTRAGALDLLDAHLGDADVADRAAVDVRLDRAEALLERGLGIDPVQVVEADRLGPQRAQALLDLRARAPPAGLRPRGSRPSWRPALPRRAVERLADRALALAARVEVRGVDVAHARRDGLADEVDVLGRGRQAVRAEADARHLDAG